MAEFRMPALGADMESGTVVEWLVAPGDAVTRGDVIAVVDTEKAAIDVECFDTGVVESLLVQPGERVAVGAPLAIIAPAGAAVRARRGAEGPSAAPAGAPSPAPPALTVVTPRPAAPLASPIVRKLAADAGLDLHSIRGTGPGGRINRVDVERAIARLRRGGPAAPVRPAPAVTTTPQAWRPAAPEAAQPSRPRISPYARTLAAARGIDPARLTPSGNGVVHAADVPRVVPAARPVTAPADAAAAARAVTAALMARSKREIPHYYLSSEIAVGTALEWLRAHNREIPVPERVLPAAMLLRAVALAVRAVPALNGHWVDGRFVPGEGVHLGFAVALRGGGLVTPVLRDADLLGLDRLMARMSEIARRARSGRLRSSEAAGATITVTNLGDLGVDTVTGVIYPPQVALVGFGTVRPRPWVSGDAVTVQPIVTASLSADHRASDGATGARLLHEIDHRLQHPEELR